MGPAALGQSWLLLRDAEGGSMYRQKRPGQRQTSSPRTKNRDFKIYLAIGQEQKEINPKACQFQLQSQRTAKYVQVCTFVGQSRAGLGLWGQSQAGACWPVGLDPDLLPPDVAFLGTGAQHIPACGRPRAEPAPASKVGTVPVLVMWRHLCPPPDPPKHPSPPKQGQGCYLLSLPLICTWQY